MDFWDYAEAVFLERGVLLERNGDSEWCYGTASRPAPVAPSPVNAPSALGLRPIVVRCRSIGTETRYSTVLPSKPGRLLNTTLSELRQFVYKRKNGISFLKTQSLFFLLNALIYHCEKLASEYSHVLKEHGNAPYSKDVDRVVTACHEAFFEFDALVTAAIRAIDSTRQVVWDAFGGNGSVPSSFSRTVRGSVRLPVGLRKKLESFESTRLVHAKEYRDCIQHYVAVGSSSWGMLYRVMEHVWALIVRIPDNPESRSARRFKFEAEYDALTYA